MMAQIIKFGQASIVFSPNDAFVAAIENFGRDLYICDLTKDKKIQTDIESLNAFSVVFSEDSKYCAILLFEEISSDLKKISIAECETGKIIKTVELENYLKKSFSVITEMRFCNNAVVVSFQYTDASGAVIMRIDLKNNFTTQTKYFKSMVIYHLNCSEENIIAFVKETGKTLSQKQSIKLICSDKLTVLNSTEFGGVLENNYYLHSFNTEKDPVFVSMTSALYLIPFVRHKKYSCFSIEASPESLKPTVFATKIGKKLPRPEQFVYEKEYMLAEQKVWQNGSKKKIYGVYRLDNLKLVGEFLFGDRSIYYKKDENCVDLLSDFDIAFSKNESFIAFYLSSTGKYFHLVTNKNSYVFEASEDFLNHF